MKCSLFSAGGELKRLKKRLGTKAGTNNKLNLKVMPSMKIHTQATTAGTETSHHCAIPQFRLTLENGSLFPSSAHTICSFYIIKTLSLNVYCFSAIHINLLHARPSSFIFWLIPLILTFFYLYSQHFRVFYSLASKKMTTMLQHTSFKYETLCFCSYVLNISWVSFSS